MFSQLSDRILGSIKKIRGQHKITPENVEEIIKEIRLSLLEADVNFRVVKSFIEKVRAKALGTEVVKSINPGQQFVKIVHDELVATLGGTAAELNLRASPAILFLVGLQGAGKTTSCAKLSL